MVNGDKECHACVGKKQKCSFEPQGNFCRPCKSRGKPCSPRDICCKDLACKIDFMTTKMIYKCTNNEM